MNGPKVRNVLKSVPVSDAIAHKLICKFLEREGVEEVMLHENLTRLQTIGQSFSRVLQQQQQQHVTPSQVKDNAVDHDVQRISTPRTEGSGAEPPSRHLKEKKEKKSKKSSEKEAKKLAKKERKEKRKRDPSASSEKKKRRKIADL